MKALRMTIIGLLLLSIGLIVVDVANGHRTSANITTSITTTLTLVMTSFGYVIPSPWGEIWIPAILLSMIGLLVSFCGFVMMLAPQPASSDKKVSK